MGDTQDWYDSVEPGIVRSRLLNTLGVEVDRGEEPSVQADFETVLEDWESELDDITFKLKDGTEKVAVEVVKDLWYDITLEDQGLEHERDNIVELVRGLGID